MSNIKMLTEDEVRDSAKIILGFDAQETDVKQGTGQITTFKELGSNCNLNNHKPDGWYLPNDRTKVAIVLETKSEKQSLENQKWVDELLVNIDIVGTKYKEVVGILYNGIEQRVFLNKDEIIKKPKELQNKDFYLDLFTNKPIDTQ